MFGLLEKAGVPTHLVKELNDRETLVKKVSIVPLEVIVRNVAAGSFSKKLGIEEGTKLLCPTLEFSYDPFINDYYALALGLATKEEIDLISKYAFKVNEFMLDFFKKLNIDLIDFKIEFGKTSDGTIILADEISPDTCRFWDSTTHEKLDKDRFRRDLGKVREAYEEILARLEAEQANPVADVVILASWSDGLSMKADGQLESYTPANADLINSGWMDDNHTLFGYSASAVGVIYNTTVIPELNADWSELADTQYKDMIAIPDTEKSGACKDFLAGLVTGMENGEAILQSWVDNGLNVPGANKAALEAVTTGEKGILIAGVDYNAYSSMKKGEPLNIYYPASGTVVNPRPAMILKSAPNMENAKAFVDFLFSDEAQKLVADAFLLPGRSDVQCENRTNLADIPQIPTDWDKMMEIASDTAAKLNSLCE